MVHNPEAEVRPDLWQEFAECKAYPHINFYPDLNDLRGILRAKRVCQDCMVSADCLEEAFMKDEQGIWGGTTERDRIRMTQARKQA